MSVMFYRNYRDFLNEKISENATAKGYKTQMARALRIQTSYLSQILSEKIEITPDHALALCEFWRLSPEETDFFIELVHHARASSPSLRKRIENRIELLAFNKESFVTSPIPMEQLDILHAAEYCSDWTYPAIYMALEIPELNTVAALAKSLTLTAIKVKTTLKGLVKMGLIFEEGHTFRATQKNLVIPSSSLQNLYHSQIREKGRERNTEKNTQDLFYNIVGTLSEEHIEEFRADVRALFARLVSKLNDTKDEHVIAYAVDFMQLTKQR